MALLYTEDAMKELARLSTHAESETARVAAIKELLDRGYGKPTQALEHGVKDGGSVTFTWMPAS